MQRSDYALDVCEAVKDYGTVRALDKVSIQVLNNEFFTLLGPSGCGKTTLLRMIVWWAGWTALSCPMVQRILRMPKNSLIS